MLHTLWIKTKDKDGTVAPNQVEQAARNQLTKVTPKPPANDHWQQRRLQTRGQSCQTSYLDAS